MKKQLLLYFLLFIIINAHTMNMQNLQKYAWPTVKVIEGIGLMGISVLPIKNKILRTIVDEANFGYTSETTSADGSKSSFKFNIPLPFIIGTYLAYNGTKELLKPH
jgi:hypothetical protein